MKLILMRNGTHLALEGVRYFESRRLEYTVVGFVDAEAFEAAKRRTDWVDWDKENLDLEVAITDRAINAAGQDWPRFYLEA
jgi:hypothetical protein